MGKRVVVLNEGKTEPRDFPHAGYYFVPERINAETFAWLSEDFDRLIFEDGDQLKSGFDTLFLSKEYQSKLTAKQMLEIVLDETDGKPGNNDDLSDYELSGDELSAERFRYLDKDCWKIYDRLGDSLLEENLDQAYLCYENAAFLCGNEGEKEELLRKKTELSEAGLSDVRKTAIIILSHNNAYLTIQCLNSIRANCSPDSCEIVVLDNASDDGIEKWLEKQKDITYIRSETNLGFPVGCNEAIRQTEKDRDIFLLNNDTRVPPNALFWLRMGIYSAEDVGACGSMVNYSDVNQIEKVEFALPEDYVRYGAEVNVPVRMPYEERPALGGFAMLIKRDALDRTGLLDEVFTPGYFEDTDLSLRIRKEGFRLFICHNSFIYHVGSQSFLKRNDLNEVYQRSFQHMKEKWEFDSTLYCSLLETEQDIIDRIVLDSPPEDVRILEVGSGLGSALGRLRYLFPEAELYGLEERDGLEKLAIRGIRTIWGENRKALPFEKHYFDYIIICNERMEAFEVPGSEEFLKDYLKNGGSLLFTRGGSERSGEQKSPSLQSVHRKLIMALNRTWEGIMAPIGIRRKKDVLYCEMLEAMERDWELFEKAGASFDDETSANLFYKCLDGLLSAENMKATKEVRHSQMPVLIKHLKRMTEGQEVDSLSLTPEVLSDLWEIPLFLQSVSCKASCVPEPEKEGNMKLRYRIEIAKEAEKREPAEIHTVVALSEGAHPWYNVELLKDCGIIPYLFHALFGCEVKMVCVENDEAYTYLPLLKGLELEFIKDEGQVSRLNYVKKNAEKIDLLIFRGGYIDNHDIAVEYKKRNPKGLIYNALDQNSEWMDRILWDSKEYTELMERCDVIGSSNGAMQKHLNEKWPWHVDCIRGGYYNLFGFHESEEELLENKEPVILSVARHGNWQKATDIMMEAFALIEKKIPEWSLRLVGTVEPEFQSFIDDYFIRYPGLRERVIFTGNITDKIELHEEYVRAGIFTLSSRMEAAPNAIPEALFNGCAIAITKVDPWQDATGYIDEEDRICGLSAEIDDAAGFSEILLSLCTSPELKEMQKNAIWRAGKYFDYETIVRDLYGKLCGKG
ncbi:MAG: glycosyltransferase [Lachnospiraceae bacterium]|nr:glycosyltransferase [Lachnospiraceae bacterium]